MLRPETGIQPQDGGNQNRDPVHGRARLGEKPNDPERKNASEDPVKVKFARIWAKED